MRLDLSGRLLQEEFPGFMIRTISAVSVSMALCIAGMDTRCLFPSAETAFSICGTSVAGIQGLATILRSG